MAGIQRLVSDAQGSRSRTHALADRAAALLFYVAAGSALVTMAVWSLLGHPAQGLTRTVSCCSRARMPSGWPYPS
ncbi:MAG: hypothetical protein R2705_15355 [Ilumatobacteraceae bacterium]